MSFDLTRKLLRRFVLGPSAIGARCGSMADWAGPKTHLSCVRTYFGFENIHWIFH